MNLKYLSYLCIGSAAVLGAYSYLVPGKNTYLTKINRASSDDNINFRLQHIDKKQRLQELQMKSLSDQSQIRGTIEESLRQHKVKALNGFDDRQEMTLENIYKHLNEGKMNEAQDLLDDQVVERLRDIEDEQEYMEAYRKAYVEAFIENAKKHGVKLRVDENLNVYDGEN